MTKTRVSKQELVRERLYKFYSENMSKGKFFTFQYFNAENIPKSTIYGIIQLFENNIGPKKVCDSGLKAKKMTSKKIDQLKKMFNNKDNISQTKASRKFNCTQQYISKILKTKTDIRKRKKCKIPSRPDDQKDQARAKYGRILRKFKNHMWVLDDESYFTLSHSTINGNDKFYTNNVHETPASIKFS